MGCQVVETITADTMADLIARRDRVTDADLVELRLDGVADVDVAGALAGRRLPAVVTCRPVWEGGRFDGGEEARLRLLAAAIREGAEYVDVEWRAAGRSALQRSERTRLVLSSHDWRGVPGDLADQVRAMWADRPAIVKVAVTAKSPRDCVALKRAVGQHEDVIAIAMGGPGQLTRVWPAWAGSCWTYGGQAAPGQVSTRELVHSYRVRSVTASATPYAIAGQPLGHSASPAMHNAAFAAGGRDALFVPIETSDASAFLDVADELGVAGASVTAPLKSVLAARASSLDALSQQVGAINTLRRAASGKWDARNFDVAGFLAPLDEHRIGLSGRRAVVLGAGGSARAVVWGLRSRGATVAISARRPDQAADLADAMNVSTAPWPPPKGWDLLVNTTPVGTWPGADELPVPESALGDLSRATVYDLVYNPEETALLRRARAAGATVVGGLDMLVAQACCQQEWWTGRPADRDVIAAAAREWVRRT